MQLNFLRMARCSVIAPLLQKSPSPQSTLNTADWASPYMMKVAGDGLGIAVAEVSGTALMQLLLKSAPLLMRMQRSQGAKASDY